MGLFFTLLSPITISDNRKFLERNTLTSRFHEKSLDLIDFLEVIELGIYHFIQ